MHNKSESFWFIPLQLTLAGGERRREVFIHSLELGHSAGTRAVKAMGKSEVLYPESLRSIKTNVAVVAV